AELDVSAANCQAGEKTARRARGKQARIDPDAAGVEVVTRRDVGREREIDSDETKARPQLKQERWFGDALHKQSDQLFDSEKIKPEPPPIQTHKRAEGRLWCGPTGPNRV